MILQWRHCMLFSLLYTWPAHARKGGMFKTPYSAQGICQSEIKWDGEVCPSEQGTKVPFAAVSERYVVCEWMDACLRACRACMTVHVFYLSMWERIWDVNFIYFRMWHNEQPHLGGGGEGRTAVTDRSSCLKLCTKLSDQTSCFDLEKSALFSCPSLWWNVTLWRAFWCEQMFSRTNSKD